MVAVHVLWDFKPEANAAAVPMSGKATLSELTVERIKIVDSTGKTRVILSNADRFPDPMVRGKPVPRSIHTSAGLLLYYDEGNEAGGLATSRRPKGHELPPLILDYGHQPTDGIRLVKSESPDGKHYTAGRTIAGRLL